MAEITAQDVPDPTKQTRRTDDDDDDQSSQETFRNALIGVLSVVAPPVAAGIAVTAFLQDKLGLEGTPPTRQIDRRRGGGSDDRSEQRRSLVPATAPVEDPPPIIPPNLANVGARANRRLLGDQFTVPTRRRRLLGEI